MKKPLAFSLSIVLLFSFFAMTGCQLVSLPYGSFTVYACGYYDTDIDSSFPCYWKDGKRIDLPTGGQEGAATSIQVYEGVVYTAGCLYSADHEYTPCFWKDTERTDLGSETDTGEAQSLQVIDGVVYTAGCLNDLPCYWTGTAITLLDLGGHDLGIARGICVSDGVVYTAGELDSADFACYWKDTSLSILPYDWDPGMLQYSATSIQAVDGVVYFSAERKGGTSTGGFGDTIEYWKDDGTLHCEWSIWKRYGASINSILINDGSIYTVGMYTEHISLFPVNHPFYAKDGVMHDLPTKPRPLGSSDMASAIQVVDGQIFTAGHTDWYPCCWIDNNYIILGGEKYRGEVLSLHVLNGS